MSTFRRPGRFALWRCRTLGWHPWRYRCVVDFDGVNMHQHCRRCGFTGLADSQGNLF